MTLFKVKLTAPDTHSLVAEVTRSIDEETPERSFMGAETVRYFAAAGEKVTFVMSPGDEMEVAEFDRSYKSLKQLMRAETEKREAECALDPIMPELRVAADYDGEMD